MSSSYLEQYIPDYKYILISIVSVTQEHLNNQKHPDSKQNKQRTRKSEMPEVGSKDNIHDIDS
jgi:hypothetical protein